MATYKEIFGKQIKFLSSDPANEAEGQIWYNSTSGTFKSALLSEAWSSGSAMITARRQVGGFGTQTAAVAVCGQNPSAQALAEEYNGLGWTAITANPEVRIKPFATGIETAGLVGGGESGPSSGTNAGEWNGTAWGTSTTIPETMYDSTAFGPEGAAVAISGSSASPTASVLLYDGGAWTSGTVTPESMASASASGLPTAGLVFGGNPGKTITLEYASGTWTTGGVLNTGRDRGAASLNGTQTETIYFGGNYPGPTEFTATESYDGTSWTTSPATLATATRGQGGAGSGTAALSFGGYTGSDTAVTEEYNKSGDIVTAAAWAAGGNYPTNVGDFSGAGTQTAAIAFGGRLYPGPNSVTNISATYDGASWTLGPNLQTARMLAASGKNGSPTAALCTGGSEPALSDKCEEFNGSIWAEGPNYPTTAQFGDQGVGDQGDALISGGYGGAPGSAYLDATSTYNGSTWTALGAPSNLQDSRFSATATGTSALALMLSGTGGAGKVESWDGSAWSEQTEANTSRTAGGSAGPSTDALYYGGEGPTGVTEGWDGTAWSTRPTMGTARFSLASCGTSTLALATGGFTSSNSTEEFTGTTTAANYRTITTS